MFYQFKNDKRGRWVAIEVENGATRTRVYRFNDYYFPGWVVEVGFTKLNEKPDAIAYVERVRAGLLAAGYVEKTPK